MEYKYTCSNSSYFLTWCWVAICSSILTAWVCICKESRFLQLNVKLWLLWPSEHWRTCEPMITLHCSGKMWLAENYFVNATVLPGRRRLPARYEDGDAPTEFDEILESRYRHVYFEALDNVYNRAFWPAWLQHLHKLCIKVYSWTLQTVKMLYHNLTQVRN